MTENQLSMLRWALARYNGYRGHVQGWDFLRLDWDPATRAIREHAYTSHFETAQWVKRSVALVGFLRACGRIPPVFVLEPWYS